MPRSHFQPKISSRLERRIRRARKTGKTREFQLMQMLRPERPSVVAEGDSWFAYPPPNLVGIDNRSNIINWLSRARPVNLLQLASNGDEAVSMLSGQSKHRLLDILQRYPVDFLLFSGGGNDIVGRHDFEFLLRQVPLGDRASPEAWLHNDRVQRRLSMIELIFADLVDLCRVYSRNPKIRIVTHCYDHAAPSPLGARFIGGLLRPDRGRSWMYPALQRHRVPENMHAPIARWLIDQLAERLGALADASGGAMHLVDTRGSVPEGHWANEIHPDQEGFGRIGARILSRLEALDPRFRKNPYS
jgi:hypothetical protein